MVKARGEGFRVISLRPGAADRRKWRTSRERDRVRNRAPSIYDRRDKTSFQPMKIKLGREQFPRARLGGRRGDPHTRATSTQPPRVANRTKGRQPGRTVSPSQNCGAGRKMSKKGINFANQQEETHDRAKADAGIIWGGSKTPLLMGRLIRKKECQLTLLAQPNLGSSAQSIPSLADVRKHGEQSEIMKGQQANAASLAWERNA